MKKTLMIASLMTVAVRAVAADYSYAAENTANRSPTVLTTERATVEAELARATKSGDLYGLHGSPFKRVAPRYYPADPPVYSMTVTQARAELARAMRNGDMLAANETGLTMNQLSPSVYANARKEPAEELAADPAELDGATQPGE